MLTKIGWFLFNGKTNHLLVELSNGRIRPVCNHELLPDFGASWRDWSDEFPFCYRCLKNGSLPRAVTRIASRAAKGNTGPRVLP